MVKKPVVGEHLPDPPDDERLKEVLFQRMSAFYSELCDELTPKDLFYSPDDAEDYMHHLIKQTTVKVLQGDTCIGSDRYALLYQRVW